MKKTLALVLALALCLPFGALALAAEAPTYPVSDKPITLSAMGHISGLYVDVKDYNEIPAIQTFSKVTGINFEWQVTNGDNEKEQINLSFASRKMPDVYTHMSKVDAIKYGEQGALVDLMPLIEAYAPNIMAALKADPSTLPMYTTAEGKLYMIPQIDADYRLSTFKTMVIQKAWLDQLGLQAPTTPDELYEVLKAFKDNAAALTDQVMLPYSSYFSANMEGWFDTFSWAFDMYGARGYAKDGIVVYGALEPAFLEAMAFVRKLYKEGLIDPDLSANKDDATFEAKMASNRVGVGFVGQGRIGMYNQKSTYEKFEFVPMIPLKNAEGKVKFGPIGPLAHTNPVMTMSINNKHPEETIKAWDWFFSEEGKIAMNLGIEGDTFVYVDGIAQYTDKIMKDPNLNANQSLLKYIAPLYEFPCARIYDFERAQLGPVLAGYKTEMQGLGALDGVKNLNLGTLPVSAEQVGTYASVEEDIATYINESLTKFITGEWNLEGDYQAFVETLNRMGIKDLLAVLNEGYGKMAN